MSGALKKTTGLVGLAVVPNAKEVLVGSYQKILKEISAMPADAGYRKQVEAVTNHRLGVASKSGITDEEIETELNCGQIEELIVQAKDELSLAKKMLEWKPWEPLAAPPLKDQWKFP
eukprot:Nk52_evm1s941 gene=Nk52_evmTU1s941